MFLQASTPYSEDYRLVGLLTQLNLLDSAKSAQTRTCCVVGVSGDKRQLVTGGWVVLEVATSAVLFFGLLSFIRPLDVNPVRRSSCTAGEVAARAAAIIPNFSRNHRIFLQTSDYFWAENRSAYSLPYGTKGNELLLMQTLALTEHFHVPQTIDSLQCRRCVVVGNGYQLKNSSLGDVIDQYDVVIRLNNGPVYNYESDVGSKTTIRLFYPESANFDLTLDNNPETLMVLVPFKSLDLKWLLTMLNDEKPIKKGFWRSPPIIWKVKPENLRILNPYFMQVAAIELLKYNLATKKIKPIPTTGIMAISFAIHFCDQVDIAGFGYPSVKTQYLHYYDKLTLKNMEVSQHKIPLEAIAIKKLLQQNIIHNLTYF
ncbi:CMP-N-acetylneuraminate-beta-galactosamide-alpha-2,3-sialyltransferase 4-like [Ranitomeya variabilis]|uniref:CMP-N-acetylneuraminate-beta-galactosamide- alpha-2,3-sialyltransferase 4-like n=1 Tax=Ranitomeya variabilis TaxID=490064 RepID=UPI00405754CE